MQGKRRRTSRASHSNSRARLGSDETMPGDDVMGTSSLSDPGLAAVGESFKRLEKLSLIWCSSITDAGLKSFAEKCRSLKSLDLQVIVKILHFLSVLLFEYLSLSSKPWIILVFPHPIFISLIHEQLAAQRGIQVCS